MYIFYMDDSGEGKKYIFSALGVHASDWSDVFDSLVRYRRELRKHAGIFMSKELHATKFVSGRGRPSDRRLDKEMRERIFSYTLKTLAKIGPEKLMLFNSITGDPQFAYERILNRINRTMQAKNDYALIISDEGKEAEYTKLVRRMRRHNFIPSQFGTWNGGSEPTKNIPLDRIIEDPVFRDSEASYFIQVVDFCAYALLRKEVPLLARPSLGEHFFELEPICFKHASKDPYGIIR